MDAIIAGPSTANNRTHDDLPSRNEARADGLNVETFSWNPLLPTDRKWAIRFRPDGTITIVLGMRDYGKGWFSGHFASVVVARLGVPFRRVRVYYSGKLPAVLQTPRPPPAVSHRGYIGPVASAATDILERMCDQVIERGRLALAATTGRSDAEIGFDPLVGRFFVRDRLRAAASLR